MTKYEEKFGKLKSQIHDETMKNCGGGGLSRNNNMLTFYARSERSYHIYTFQFVEMLLILAQNPHVFISL